MRFCILASVLFFACLQRTVGLRKSTRQSEAALRWHWTDYGACYFTTSYTKEQILTSCAWFQKFAENLGRLPEDVRERASRRIMIQELTPGTCPEEASPAFNIDIHRYMMHSCESSMLGLPMALTNISRPCPDAFCTNTDDIIDLEPLAGRAVLVSPRLGEGKHCFEINSLYMAIATKPEDPLKSTGEPYTLEMLKADVDNGLACKMPDQDEGIARKKRKV